MGNPIESLIGRGKGVVEVTGEKFDVTNDIAGILEAEGITFRRCEPEKAINRPDQLSPHT